MTATILVICFFELNLMAEQAGQQFLSDEQSSRGTRESVAVLQESSIVIRIGIPLFWTR